MSLLLLYRPSVVATVEGSASLPIVFGATTVGSTGDESVPAITDRTRTSPSSGRTSGAPNSGGSRAGPNSGRTSARS